MSACLAVWMAAPLLAAESPCALAGVVLDEKGGPIAHAAVTVHSMARAGPLTGAISGRDGSFCLKDVPAGQLTIRASALRPSAPPCAPTHQWGSVLQHLQFVPDRPVSGLTLRMRLIPAYCVSGEVRGKGGELLPGVRLRLDHGASSTSVFNEGGRFDLSALPAGLYTLTVLEPALGGRVLLCHPIRIRNRNVLKLVVQVPEAGGQ